MDIVQGNLENDNTRKQFRRHGMIGPVSVYCAKLRENGAGNHVKE